MIRIAIVGTGNIARSHARALTAQGAAAATIVAAMDVAGRQLDSFCAEFGIPGAYRDLAHLLSRARPDLVHVCTPPAAHREAALACLRAGASVLVEKPPALSLREFDEVAGYPAGQISRRPMIANTFVHSSDKNSSPGKMSSRS
jgi:predicted dehydrogenase